MHDIAARTRSGVAPAVEQDLAPCLAAARGGACEAAFEAALARCRPALDGARRARDDGAWPWLALPRRDGDIAALEATVAARRGSFDSLVLLGAGGSSLGARALCALAPPGAKGAPRVCDNLDARGFAATLAGLDLSRALFLAVSKSGATAETLAQFAVAADAVRAAGAAARDAFLVVCAPGDNPLRRLADRMGAEVVDHPPDLPGRYSALSAVGLLPALFAGLDARALRAGAAEAADGALDGDPRESPPALGAALQAAFAGTRGAGVSVLLPYDDRLEPFAAWWRQLWAESLGKDGRGTTPATALGPRDQHSQLQLWLDGPADKFFTVIAVDGTPEAPAAPPWLATAAPELAWLAGARLGDLVAAMRRATVESLAAAGRPVRVLRLAALDERRLGALLMHFMIETVVAAGLSGANPFDQPAVERGKRLARRYLEEGAA